MTETGIFKEWIGRTETAKQAAERWPILGLCALLDKHEAPGPGDPIPPAAHWTYFGPTVPQSQIGADGHPERKGLLPPIVQPRRMWAASDITFSGEIRVGDVMTKTARIADISEKEGKTGSLIFVNIDNRYHVGGTEVLSEVQTLVYRDHPGPGEAPPPVKAAPTSPAWSHRIDPDPVMLFRYSAVTFNGHRIHYDEPYTTHDEGYPGIIVQGQLTATLLLDQFRTRFSGRPIRSFNFRAVKPLFSGRPFFLEGAEKDDGSYSLWARDEEGGLSMVATLS
ncbi:FAS1-like dehydratase domain-containing protein [Microvirga makkahensis]|uniref:Acyl-CoA dehydrogenase n=1 Tax=Microvirga makkahensis TaxID=1128670 RepID=A0A7X3SN56_9HYPH|nr:MaoC family dehydratase N-terminal domain-containing protein [Microvirga makkahensis]MXQ10714.1 acyl-CoA dehydrogenase [Microvirga makkahensis]